MPDLHFPQPRPDPGLRKRLPAILLLRCPECLQGRIRRKWFSTRDTCPACGVRLETEPGYYTGAMYVSYVLQVPIFAALALSAHLLLPGWPMHLVLLLAWLPALPFLPAVFLYSRVIWLHLDRYLQSHDPSADFPCALAPKGSGEDRPLQS